ncbi:MAG: rRNA methylase [Akkermansiaceae bacterium]|nr:rRNA methylase [Akkermansiaceae bacterium]
MNERREKPTVRAHREIAAVLRPGETAIDATAGNGHDTVFLAQLAGEQGTVLSFDVQEAAITSSKQRIETFALKGVRFILASHATLADHASPGRVGAVVFNLGYLPGGDHSLVTTRDVTLVALDAALGLLRPGGILSVVCYPGHPGGDVESDAVVVWASSLGAGFEVEVDRPESIPRSSPFLVLVRRS